jgi:hypothetical protein
MSSSCLAPGMLAAGGLQPVNYVNRECCAPRKLKCGGFFKLSYSSRPLVHGQAGTLAQTPLCASVLLVQSSADSERLPKV